MASTGPFIIPGPPSSVPVQLLIALKNQDLLLPHTVVVTVDRQSFGAPAPTFPPVAEVPIFIQAVTLLAATCTILIVPASPVTALTGFDANDILKVIITGEFGPGLIEASVVGRHSNGRNEPTMFIPFEKFISGILPG